MKKISITIVIMLLAAGAGAAIYITRENAPPPERVLTWLPTPRSLPQVTFKDHLARSFTTEDYAEHVNGRWSLWFFGFTSCPSICPIAMHNLNGVFDTLSAKEKAKLAITLVSVDPKRDTTTRLQDYVLSFNTQFLGLRLEPKDLATLREPLGVVAETLSNDKNYDIDHSGTLYLLNPQGQWVALATSPVDYDLLAKDLNALL